MTSGKRSRRAVLKKFTHKFFNITKSRRMKTLNTKSAVPFYRSLHRQICFKKIKDIALMFRHF